LRTGKEQPKRREKRQFKKGAAPRPIQMGGHFVTKKKIPRKQREERGGLMRKLSHTVGVAASRGVAPGEKGSEEHQM